MYIYILLNNVLRYKIWQFLNIYNNFFKTIEIKTAEFNEESQKLDQEIEKLEKELELLTTKEVYIIYYYIILYYKIL